MKNFPFMPLLGAVFMLSSPVLFGQTTTGNPASSGQRPMDTSMARLDREEGRNYGWLGLIGLMGLAGFLRRNDRNAPRSQPVGVNR